MYAVYEDEKQVCPKGVGVGGGATKRAWVGAGVARKMKCVFKRQKECGRHSPQTGFDTPVWRSRPSLNVWCKRGWRGVRQTGTDAAQV
eukprot:354181-Chlamydomonas_euryale.AAC.7